MDIIRAVSIAIEGQEALLYRWQSDLTDKYTQKIVDMRCKSVSKEISELRSLRRKLKKDKNQKAPVDISSQGLFNEYNMTICSNVSGY